MTNEIGDYVTSAQECPVCSNTESRILSKIGRNGQELTTAICTGCGLVHSHPIPTSAELEEYYTNHYRNDYKNTFTPKRKHILRYSRHALARISRLRDFVKEKGKLLDIGSGSGEFVYIAKLAGYDVQGLEPHAGYSEYTRKTFDVPIMSTPFQKADIAAESFDIITLHHVLEHLEKPFEALAKLNSWLKMGGVISIDVPDIEATQHSPNSRFHYAHIYNFSHENLKALLQKAGFEVFEDERYKSTILVAKKVAQPNPNLAVSLGENYQRIWDYSQQGSVQHHLKTSSIKRLIGKFYRYPTEFLKAAFIRSPKRIALREFEKSTLATAISSVAILG